VIFLFTYLFIYSSIYFFVHSIIHWKLLDPCREYYRLVVVKFVSLTGWRYCKLTVGLAVCFKVDQLHGLIFRTVKTSKESIQNYNLNFNQFNLKFQGVWMLYSPRISVYQNIQWFRWQDDKWKMKCNTLEGSIQEVNLNVYSGWHDMYPLPIKFIRLLFGILKIHDVKSQLHIIHPELQYTWTELLKWYLRKP
jgi:hypothetical protein